MAACFTPENPRSCPVSNKATAGVIELSGTGNYSFMNRIVMAVTLLAGSIALACDPAGVAGVSMHVGHIGFDLSVGRRPCPEVVYVAQASPGYERETEFFSGSARPPPPPVVYVQPPVVYVAPPPPPAPPPVVHTVVVEEPSPVGPSLIALKYMPGLASNIGFGFDTGFVGSNVAFAQSAGIEVRLNRWFALRMDGELRNDGRSFDPLGIKLALAPSFRLRPYGSISLSLNDAPRFGNRLTVGLMAAAGLDLYFGRHFFIEAEVRYRRVPGCCQEEGRLTGMIGAGVAFF